MKVLINRTDAIGDTILTLPMARMIKEKFPDAQVFFMVSKKTADIFRYYPDVDGIMVMDVNETWIKRFFKTLKLFIKNKFDTYLFVGGSHIPSYSAWICRVRYRGGLRSKWQTFFFLNKSVRQKRSIVEMHETDYNLNLLKPLGINFHYKNGYKYKPVFTMDKNDSKNAIELFEAEVKDSSVIFRREIIFIHPGMTGHTLNWSATNYARLVVCIERQWPGKYLFVLSHTQADMKYVRKFRNFLDDEKFDFLKNKIYYFDGGVKGLSNYVTVLDNASLFIGPSTGNTHMANALGVPLVAIYSPIKVQSAMRWGPYHRDSCKCRVVVPDVVCGEQYECAGERCIYYKCMAKIEVDDVFQEVRKIFDEKSNVKTEGEEK